MKLRPYQSELIRKTETNATMEYSEQEVWKDIPGYDGFYQVSSQGRIWSIRRKDSMGRDKGGLFLRLRSCGGYQKVCLNKDGVKRTYNVHRIVAQAFIPNPDSKPQVNHKNGAKADNRASNLEWVDPIENMAHAKSNGLLHDFRGDSHHSSTLNSDDVIEIRRSTRTQADLAKAYGVHRSTISRIRRGKRWAHV